MTQANDSILVSPGSGATVATHLVASKEHQVMMLAAPSGHIWGARPTYFYYRPHTAGAQNQRTIDIFNASGSGVLVRLQRLFLYHDQTALTGVGHRFELATTTAVGTGGTVITGRTADSNNDVIPAQVTSRFSATGGATVGALLFGIVANPEETLAAASVLAGQNWLPVGDGLQEITLREGEGVVLTQITNNTAGLWAVNLVVTIE